eukprot:GEMP01007991.1.p1 GENE.GEMP01007991.1~~GEMP01007991.1.p1  ORF type:complete len:592 (+),score=142.73 GEMP01007991.1:167-1942(+)
MEEENLASQILMEEAEDSLTSLPRQRTSAHGAANSANPGFTLPDIGGQWPDDGNSWNQHQYGRGGAKGRGGGRQGGDEWNLKRFQGQKHVQQSAQPPYDGQASQYWPHDPYRQPPVGQRGDAMTMQQQQQQQQFYFMNPWAMQHAAASAMIQMGKDPTNPQHWVQMAQPAVWPPASGPQPSRGKLPPTQYEEHEEKGSFNRKFNVPQQDGQDGRGSYGNKKGRRRRKKQRDSQTLGEEEETPLPPNCSPLLEEFRTKNKKLELVDIKWNIIEFATDQFGSRFIQQKLETASDEEKQLVEVAILQEFQQLTTDVFGNYVVQKMFEYGSPSQRRNLAEQLVGDVLKQSLHMYGCRVIQKALESVSVEQQMLLVGELQGHVIQCVEDQNGNHVIQKCIERMPPEKIQFIVDAFKGCVQRMACHCYGCRVLQRLIEHCTPPQQVAPILDEIARCIPQLSQDQYGNYVVQHMLEHGRSHDRRLILEVVRTQILMLSCHKFASNVVEKAILCSSFDERAPLLHAIVGEPTDVNPALLTMMRDRYGNYIVQRLLELAQDSQREMLLWRLKDQVHVLKKFTYGKHIVQALEERESRLAQ